MSTKLPANVNHVKKTFKKKDANVNVSEAARVLLWTMNQVNVHQINRNYFV